MDCVDFPRVLPNSPRKARGQIQVIFGPMFSGKSTELMRRVRRFQIAQYNCLVIKYAKDKRYSDTGMATHDKSTMEAVPASCLEEMRPLALQACVIGIDEGQFFTDTVAFCEEMANLGKIIIVAALDGTFQRKTDTVDAAEADRAPLWVWTQQQVQDKKLIQKELNNVHEQHYNREPFGNILNLIPLAESVVKLHAVCMQCYKEAAYTKRIGAEKEVEVIGGTDKYQAVCRKCYGGLVVDKENSAPFRNETPQPVVSGKLLDSAIPRKLFSSLQL